jgi:hypothetical protein
MVPFVLFQLSVTFFGFRLVRCLAPVCVGPWHADGVVLTQPSTLPLTSHFLSFLPQVKHEAIETLMKLVSSKREYVRYIR